MYTTGVTDCNAMYFDTVDESRRESRSVPPPAATVTLSPPFP